MTAEERAARAARIVEVARKDPELKVSTLAARFSCGLDAVRDALRAAGLKPAGAEGLYALNRATHGFTRYLKKNRKKTT